MGEKQKRSTLSYHNCIFFLLGNIQCFQFWYLTSRERDKNEPALMVFWVKVKLLKITICLYDKLLTKIKNCFICRNVPYHFWDKLWNQVFWVISLHKEEAVHMIQTGLCSRTALCMVLVQLTWEGHGENMPESYFTTQI